MKGKRGRPTKNPPTTLRGWLRRYYNALAVFAIVAVRAIPKLTDMINTFRRVDVFKKLDVPNWQKYFISPPNWGSILAYMAEKDNSPDFCMNAALKHPANLHEKLSKDIINDRKNNSEYTPESLDEKVDSLLELTDDSFLKESESSAQEIEEVLMHPASIFFMSVSMPCWINYQASSPESVGKRRRWQVAEGVKQGYFQRFLAAIAVRSSGHQIHLPV